MLLVGFKAAAGVGAASAAVGVDCSLARAAAAAALALKPFGCCCCCCSSWSLKTTRIFRGCFAGERSAGMNQHHGMMALSSINSGNRLISQAGSKAAYRVYRRHKLRRKVIVKVLYAQCKNLS